MGHFVVQFLPSTTVWKGLSLLKELGKRQTWPILHVLGQEKKASITMVHLTNHIC